MISKLKALGLTLFAVMALGAVAAQTASATEKAHEFHSDGAWTVATGENTEPHKFKAGAVGTVECKKAVFENTSWGAEISAGTYKADELTVTGRWSECTFGGQPAVVFTNDCAFKVDSDTTSGNPDGGEDANVEIECAAGHKIQIHTVNCTITVGPQLATHAIRVANDTPTSVEGGLTGGTSGGGGGGGASGLVLGKERTTGSQPVNGCLTFPTGAVGSVSGRATSNCFKDEGEGQANPTTPQATKEGAATECSLQ